MSKIDPTKKEGMKKRCSRTENWI